MSCGRIVVVAASLAILPSVAHSACNAIPPAPAISPMANPLAPNPAPTATPLFYGRIGTIDQPFMVPGNRVRIERRACDQNNGSDFSTNAPPRVTIIVNPGRRWDGSAYTYVDKPRALIVESDAVGCSADAVRACDQGLNGVLDGDAKCTTIPSGQYELTTKSLRFPVPDPADAFLEAHGGPTGVAVTSRTADPPCRELAAKTCLEALPPQYQPGTSWHACVDELYTQDLTCKFDPRDATFGHLTLLPKWNNSRQTCFFEPGYCTSAEEELRFAVDSDRNILIPMFWQDDLSKCTSPCGFPVRGDLVAPTNRWIALPNNSNQKNPLLKSFSPEGFPLDPLFINQATNVTGGFALSGTFDGPASVLRVHSGGGICKDTNGNYHGRCRRTKDCASNEVCTWVCIGGDDDGNECTNNSGCRGKGKCGKVHDFDAELKQGGWRLVRGEPKFKEESDPSRTCSASNQSWRCVSYQLEVSAPFSLPTLTPQPTPQSTPDPQPLQSALDTQVPGAAIDGRPIVSEPLEGGPRIASFVTLPASHAGGSDGRGLVVARLAGCTTLTSPCDLRLLDLSGYRPIDASPNLTFAGSQVRVLVEEEPGTRSFWSRLFAGRRAAAPRYPLLMIYDVTAPSTDAPKLLLVSRVDLSDRAHYDPLRLSDNGSTTYLSPSGRCEENGHIVPVPSQCVPDSESSGCPAGTGCRPTSVVVAVDLSTDDDRNGVPDVLQPPPVPLQNATSSSQRMSGKKGKPRARH